MGGGGRRGDRSSFRVLLPACSLVGLWSIHRRLVRDVVDQVCVRSKMLYAMSGFCRSGDGDDNDYNSSLGSAKKPACRSSIAVARTKYLLLRLPLSYSLHVHEFLRVSSLLVSCYHYRPNTELPPWRGRSRVQKLSRETKKQQRRTFRQLFATIGENEPPEEVVSLQNGSLTVADWAHIKQLNALRACLQSGFQVRERATWYRLQSLERICMWYHMLQQYS